MAKEGSKVDLSRRSAAEKASKYTNDYSNGALQMS